MKLTNGEIEYKASFFAPSSAFGGEKFYYNFARSPYLCLGPVSNRGPFALQANALPTELPKQLY